MEMYLNEAFIFFQIFEIKSVNELMKHRESCILVQKKENTWLENWMDILLEAAGFLPLEVLKQRLEGLWSHFRYGIKDKILALRKKWTRWFLLFV